MAKISRNDVQVVIVASPGMGHTIPSLELAKCLVSNHGVHVTFFAPTATTDQFQLDFLHTPSSLPRNLHIINLPPIDISNSVSRSPDTDVVTRISTVVRESLPTIQSIIEKLPQRPTVMITDLFATDAFLVADVLNMEKYFFFTSNVTALAIMAYNSKMLELDRDDQDGTDELLRVPGCKTYRLKDIGGVGSFLDQTSGSFECGMNHARRFVKATGVLVNTFEDLEIHTTNNLVNDHEIQQQIPLPRVYTVGPMIRSLSSSSSSSSSDGIRSDCLMWLDTHPCDSVLLVSFGSGGTLSAEQLTELAWGLELSQQRFIWVVRKPIDVVGNESSDPSEYLPNGFLNRVRGRGLVVPDWAPQIKILSHVAVGGFLSHCGWNSTLESIVHGVPMIPLPMYNEQHLNALVVCDDLKVAVRPPIQSGDGIVGREEIERVVRSLMEGQEGKVLRCRAKVFKTSAAEAVNEGGSSYNALSQVVEKWMES